MISNRFSRDFSLNVLPWSYIGASMAAPATPAHLIVVSHGQWGTKTDVSHLTKHLTSAGGSSVTVVAPSCNHITGTYSGIDTCAARLVQEIKLAVSAGSYSSFSCIGYSAGGLFLRYAVGVLHAEGFFAANNLHCEAFITVATPHVGIRHSPRSWVGRTRNGMIGAVSDLYGGRSLTQMMLHDADGESQQPLLLAMSTPGSRYMQALAQFASFTVYANVYNDHSVNYCSAAIAPRNPYKPRRRVAKQHSADTSTTATANAVPGYPYIAAVTESAVFTDTELTGERQQRKMSDSVTATSSQQQQQQQQSGGSSSSVHPLQFVVGLTLLLPLVLVQGVLLIVPLRLAAALNDRKTNSNSNSSSDSRSKEQQQQHSSVSSSATGSASPRGDSPTAADAVTTDDVTLGTTATTAGTAAAATAAAGDSSTSEPQQADRVQQEAVDAVPRRIRANFAAAGLRMRRVDVMLPAVNTHGAIVVRRGFYKNSGGQNVVRHIATAVLHLSESDSPTATSLATSSEGLSVKSIALEAVEASAQAVVGA